MNHTAKVDFQNMQMKKLSNGKKVHFKPVWCGRVYACTISILSWIHLKAADAFQWYHSTYAAFCRMHGTHWTQAVGSHCWNSKLLENIQGTLEGSWLSLENWVFTQRVHLVNAMRTAFEENLECLNGIALISLTTLICLLARHSFDADKLCRKCPSGTYCIRGLHW